jgi:hypothetical protein
MAADVRREPRRRGAAKQAGASDRAERKEKVLHTRVPESLDRHIKTRARGLGLSVSTVVRNVLLHTFGLVEDIVTDSTKIALAIAGEDTAAPGDVLAWQEVVLNRNAVCEQCNAVIRKGARAALGMRAERGPQVILCPQCLDRVADENTDAPLKSGRHR